MRRANTKNSKDLHILSSVIGESLTTKKRLNQERDANCFSFKAPLWVDKGLVKDCFNKIFHIDPLKVRTMNSKKSIKNFKGRPYVSSASKTVIVKLKDMGEFRNAISNIFQEEYKGDE